jgi:hypothetical protein
LAPLKHGHSTRKGKSPTYRAWAAMVRRCSNPRTKDWPLYGGRGIIVCSRWRQFANFLADMGERPTGQTLDRIDSDGAYEPGNCRWASSEEQAQTRRPRASFELNPRDEATGRFTRREKE